MSGRIVDRSIEFVSPWLEVVVKDVELAQPRGRETFYAVRTADYAAVVAVTEEGLIPLVRQFRPVVEEHVLELPSGTLEPGEEPEAMIRRELLEETGCAGGELTLIGRFLTDSGRMETRQWGFLATGVRRVAEPQGDEQLELRFVTPAELGDLVRRGEFRMAGHLAVLGAAVMKGLIVL